MTAVEALQALYRRHMAAGRLLQANTIKHAIRVVRKTEASMHKEGAPI